MRLLVWDDGCVVEASQFSLHHPYVLQRIHTIGYKAYNLERHVALMRDASIALFGFASLCRVEDAARIIRGLLEASRVSLSLSCPVAMRLESSGRLSFEVEMPSFTAGCYLRASRPVAALIRASMPQSVVQTSVTVAIDAMTDSRIVGYGDVALWLDDADELISCPWRPVFGVYGGRVYTSAEYESVEYVMARDAIRRLGMELEVRSIPLNALIHMDEVFIVDVMGVTSVLSIKEHRLLSMATSRIADRMEPKPSKS